MQLRSHVQSLCDGGAGEVKPGKNVLCPFRVEDQQMLRGY